MVAIAPPDVLRPLTYDDLAAMPDDGKRYEIINGELFELTGPTPKHQWSSSRLYRALDRFVEMHDLGMVFYAPLDVLLSLHDLVQPDIVFVSREQLHIVRDQKIEGAPTLLMEILSASNRSRDLITKAAMYATFGVKEYWLVDPEHVTIAVQTLHQGVFAQVPVEDGIARSIVLPGFSIALTEVFSFPDLSRQS